jgi:hypothetical protein
MSLMAIRFAPCHQNSSIRQKQAKKKRQKKQQQQNGKEFIQHLERRDRAQKNPKTRHNWGGFLNLTSSETFPGTKTVKARAPTRTTSGF